MHCQWQECSRLQIFQCIDKAGRCAAAEANCTLVPGPDVDGDPNRLVFDEIRQLGPLDGHGAVVTKRVDVEEAEVGTVTEAKAVDVMERDPPTRKHMVQDEGGTAHQRGVGTAPLREAPDEAGLSGTEVALERDHITAAQDGPERRPDLLCGVRALGDSGGLCHAKWRECTGGIVMSLPL